MDRDARTSQDAAARFGGQASAITADLTGLDSTRAAALVKDARKVFNPLDILVNNAGVVRLANFLDIDVADFDLMMDVNVRAPMDIARAVSFLASEDSAYIIGQTIYVDRGRLVLNYTVPESH